MVFKKPYSPGKPHETFILERMHEVLGNLVHTYKMQETYVDGDDPLMGILAAYDIVKKSTYHRTKYKSPGHLVFC